MTVLETERLVLRWQTEDDAAFIRELVNEPAWKRFIGDRQVHTLDDARAYIRRSATDLYARQGFGFYLVERKADGAPVGICGLIKRDYLEDVDVGYALLSRYRGQGYAREATAGVLAYAHEALGLGRILAVTDGDNHRSIRLLEQLGMTFERLVESPEVGELKLFAWSVKK